MSTKVITAVTTIPTGKPTSSAVSDRRASPGRRWTRATQQPGDRAELRTYDHRADHEDRLVEQQAEGRDHRRDAHEDEVRRGQRDSSSVLASTSSQTTASVP